MGLLLLLAIGFMAGYMTSNSLSASNTAGESALAFEAKIWLKQYFGPKKLMLAITTLFCKPPKEEKLQYIEVMIKFEYNTGKMCN